MSLYKLDMDRFDEYYPGVHALYSKKCKKESDKLACCSGICNTACSKSANNCEKNWKTACADNCSEIREFPYKPQPTPTPQYEDEDEDEEDDDINIINPPKPIPNPRRKRRIGDAPVTDDDDSTPAPAKDEKSQEETGKKPSNSGLSSKEVIGISIGGVLVVVLILLLVFLIIKSKKH